VQEVLQRAEELGVPRSSGKFRQAVAALACTTKQRDTAMLEFLKTTLGCSKSEAAIAVSKVPVILSLSEQNLLRKFQFMINDVGLEPQYILERSILFTHSLEKRLVPRHCVMKILLAKGLLETNLSFYSIARMGEKSFRLRFIDYHKDSVTGLADAYAAACRGRVPSGDQL
jgi:mTERF domain-containing protein